MVLVPPAEAVHDDQGVQRVDARLMAQDGRSYHQNECHGIETPTAHRRGGVPSKIPRTRSPPKAPSVATRVRSVVVVSVVLLLLLLLLLLRGGPVVGRRQRLRRLTAVLFVGVVRSVVAEVRCRSLVGRRPQVFQSKPASKGHVQE